MISVVANIENKHTHVQIDKNGFQALGDQPSQPPTSNQTIKDGSSLSQVMTNIKLVRQRSPTRLSDPGSTAEQFTLLAKVLLAPTQLTHQP